MRALSLFAVTLAVNIPSSLLTTPKPFECLPGWTEEHRRGGGHVCGRNGGHWMCPKEWFKTNHPPFCVSEPIDNKLVKSTAGPSAVHRAMELRAELSKCGLVRFSYSCHGPDYDAWIIAHMIELEKSRHTFEVMLHRGALNSKKNSTDDAKPLNLLTKGPVLFLGGSHQGQLAEGLMCALVHGARRVLATDMTTGCLADFSEKGVETINCHGNASCGMYLARMELHKGVNGPDGGTILLANNHPWLFQGASGMDKALRHLLLSEGPFMEEAQDSSSKSRHAQGGTAHPRSLGSRAWTPSELGPKADLSQLGAIFLGEWNPKFWAEKVFRPSTEDEAARQKAGKPRSAAPGNGRCGGAQERPVQLEPWETPEVLQYLEDRGFRGTVILTGKQNPPFELPADQSVLESHARTMTFRTLTNELKSASCYVPTCGSGPQHTCIPGFPDIVAAAIINIHA
eukprot:CAMPEP_0172624026 /NCGR_PEP_ID=MMETSP1068-20121228/133380_1 /TAXON_ID=35684 /ORGANISM="Pseudopedinella elastica, Strain CCMP716" /LENGTH=454 /DNA_ID=CAMNT_0013432811 /DNA_START=187 /DNA_END=1551 /DNA_ORIENTATION=-